MYLVSKESWEQARLNAYMVAQTNSKKRLKLSDIMSFPWEADHVGYISNEDIDRLKQKAKEYGTRFDNEADSQQ